MCIIPQAGTCVHNTRDNPVPKRQYCSIRGVEVTAVGLQRKRTPHKVLLQIRFGRLHRGEVPAACPDPCTILPLTTAGPAAPRVLPGQDWDALPRPLLCAAREGEGEIPAPAGPVSTQGAPQDTAAPGDPAGAVGPSLRGVGRASPTPGPGRAGGPLPSSYLQNRGPGDERRPEKLKGKTRPLLLLKQRFVLPAPGRGAPGHYRSPQPPCPSRPTSPRPSLLGG